MNQEDIRQVSPARRLAQIVGRLFVQGTAIAVIGFTTGLISGHVSDSTPWSSMTTSEQATWAGSVSTFLAFLGALLIAFRQAGAEKRRQRNIDAGKFEAVYAVLRTVRGSLLGLEFDLSDQDAYFNAREESLQALLDAATSFESIPVMDMPDQRLIGLRAVIVREARSLATAFVPGTDIYTLTQRTPESGKREVKRIEEFLGILYRAEVICKERFQKLRQSGGR